MNINITLKYTYQSTTLDIFNKIGFEVYPAVIDNPLGDFDNKDVPKWIASRFSLSSYNYIDFDKTEIYDYLLEEI